MSEAVNETTTEAGSGGDAGLLIEAMAKLRDGDFSDIDVDAFENPELGRAYNDMLSGISDRNNRLLVRINDAMTRIADGRHLKTLLEQIESQRDSIKVLQNTRSDLNFSMKQVEESAYEMLALSRQIRNSYEPCVEDLHEEYERVTSSIDGIRDVVYGIRDRYESMDERTPESDLSMNSFVSSMERFLEMVSERAWMLDETAESLGSLKGRIEQVINDVVLIGETIGKQNDSSQSFLESVDSIANSYESLSLDAFDTGSRLYRISRDIDNARNDMFRHNSRPNMHDILRVYEVDHYTLSWRIYNHIMELETLKITQVNNPDRCKFGLWCANLEDETVRESDAFKHTFDAHEELHKHAVQCYQAKEDYDMGLAKKEFTKVLEAFDKFQQGMDELHALYIKNGVADDTPLWKFKQ